jgi:hypothetical protein
MEDYTGKVGIGTSGPTGSVHLKDITDSNGSDVFYVAQNTISNRIAGYQILDESGTVSLAMQYDNGGNAASIINQNNGSLVVYLGGTVAANALDDYEEGTWTPEFRGTTGSEGTSNTTVYGATFTKIGNMVNLECYLRWDDQGSWTGDVVLYGLPYAHEANTRSVGVMGGLKNIEMPDSLPIVPTISASLSYITFNRQISDLPTKDYALVSYFDNALNEFVLSITYRV